MKMLNANKKFGNMKCKYGWMEVWKRGNDF
jgi:hypothetical protein